MRGDVHVRFGGRARETYRPKGRPRALARPLLEPSEVDLQTVCKRVGVFGTPVPWDRRLADRGCPLRHSPARVRPSRRTAARKSESSSRMGPLV